MAETGIARKRVVSSKKAKSAVIAKMIKSHLAETGNRPLPSWMASEPDGSVAVTNIELISLTALASYVAQKTGRSAFGVEKDLSDMFGIPNLKFMPSARYDEATQYLAAQIPEINNRNF